MWDLKPQHSPKKTGQTFWTSVWAVVSWAANQARSQQNENETDGAQRNHPFCTGEGTVNGGEGNLQSGGAMQTTHLVRGYAQNTQNIPPLHRRKQVKDWAFLGWN